MTPWTATQLYYTARELGGAGAEFDRSRTCRLCGGYILLPGCLWDEAGNSSNWTDENLVRAPWSEWLCEGCKWVKAHRSEIWKGGVEALVVSPEYFGACKLEQFPEVYAAATGWPRFVAVRGSEATINKHSLFRALDAVYWRDSSGHPVFLYDFGNWENCYVGPLTGVVPVSVKRVLEELPAVEALLSKVAEVIVARTMRQEPRGTVGPALLFRRLLQFAAERGFPGIEGYFAVVLAAKRVAAELAGGGGN